LLSSRFQGVWEIDDAGIQSNGTQLDQRQKDANTDDRIRCLVVERGAYRFRVSLFGVHIAGEPRSCVGGGDEVYGCGEDIKLYDENLDTTSGFACGRVRLMTD
jgi:hypothetical protein